MGETQQDQTSATLRTPWPATVRVTVEPRPSGGAPGPGMMSLLDTCEHVTTCLEELGEQISSGHFDAAKDWAKRCRAPVVKNAREVAGRARAALAKAEKGTP